MSLISAVGHSYTQFEQTHHDRRRGCMKFAISENVLPDKRCGKFVTLK